MTSASLAAPVNLCIVVTLAIIHHYHLTLVHCLATSLECRHQTDQILLHGLYAQLMMQ